MNQFQKIRPNGELVTYSTITGKPIKCKLKLTSVIAVKSAKNEVAINRKKQSYSGLQSKDTKFTFWTGTEAAYKGCEFDFGHRRELDA